MNDELAKSRKMSRKRRLHKKLLGAALTKDAAQRSIRTFYAAVMNDVAVMLKVFAIQVVLCLTKPSDRR
jgi:hypothetical protein